MPDNDTDFFALNRHLSQTVALPRLWLQQKASCFTPTSMSAMAKRGELDNEKTAFSLHGEEAGRNHAAEIALRKAAAAGVAAKN